LPSSSPPKRILIARLSALGDIVHSLPAVAALRRALPGVTIGWAIEERWVELLAARSSLSAAVRSPARPLVDAVHTVDTRVWRSSPFSVETRRAMRSLVRELRAAEYDVTVDLQAAIRSALLNRMSRAPARLGFAKPRESLARLFYTAAIATPAVHVVDQGLQLASAILGKDVSTAEFPLPRDAAADAWCEQQIARFGGKQFALINPGAGWGAKRWPAERYAQVARSLAQQGLSVLVNSGPGEESLSRQVAEPGSNNIFSLSCSLSQLISLIRRARIFIGGDTGPSHLAAACSIPVLAIYGPTDPARNGPYGPAGPNAAHISVLRSPGSETSHARRSEPERGLLQMTADEVIAAARRLLEQTR